MTISYKFKLKYIDQHLDHKVTRIECIDLDEANELKAWVKMAERSMILFPDTERYQLQTIKMTGIVVSDY